MDPWGGNKRLIKVSQNSSSRHHHRHHWLVSLSFALSLSLSQPHHYSPVPQALIMCEGQIPASYSSPLLRVTLARDPAKRWRPWLNTADGLFLSRASYRSASRVLPSPAVRPHVQQQCISRRKIALNALSIFKSIGFLSGLLKLLSATCTFISVSAARLKGKHEQKSLFRFKLLDRFIAQLYKTVLKKQWDRYSSEFKPRFSIKVKVSLHLQSFQHFLKIITAAFFFILQFDIKPWRTEFTRDRFHHKYAAILVFLQTSVLWFLFHSYEMTKCVSLSELNQTRLTEQKILLGCGEIYSMMILWGKLFPDHLEHGWRFLFFTRDPHKDRIS